MQHDNRAEWLPVIWARHQLMRLSDWADNDVELHRPAIVKLVLKYSLLSRHTSLIAVDKVIANPDGDTKNMQQALPLPQGLEEVSARA